MTLMMNGNALQREEYPNPGTPLSRKMVWIKTRQMEAWTCFACAWAFRPSGPPLGNSLDEMMQMYELQRDKEYASHVCAEHPRARSASVYSGFSRPIEDRAFEMNPDRSKRQNGARRAS